jgi:plastocyanin
MKKTILIYVIAAAALLLLASTVRLAPWPLAAATEPGAAVKIDNFSFTPATITVAAGTEVRWTNRDDIPHTVVADDRSFKSKALDTDDEFAFTFSKPGTYKYFCSLHPKMTATIVVN